MNIEVKDILTNWLYELYKAKGFDNITERDPAEFNIWTAEIKAQWDALETKIGWIDSLTLEDYEEELSHLEEENAELIDANMTLSQEKDALLNRLREISRVVNDTWC